MNKISIAKEMALEAHRDQKYGGLPYSYHLRQVVTILEFSRMWINSNTENGAILLAAAWLHDAVEDTDLTLNEIRERLGGRVTRLVDAVTDEPGKNRKERKAKTYIKLRKAPVEAKAIKLADRIANTRASIENPDLAAMYRAEFPEFVRAVSGDALTDDLTVELLFLHLDSLEQVK